MGGKFAPVDQTEAGGVGLLTASENAVFVENALEQAQLTGFEVIEVDANGAACLTLKHQGQQVDVQDIADAALEATEKVSAIEGRAVHLLHLQRLQEIHDGRTLEDSMLPLLETERRTIISAMAEHEESEWVAGNLLLGREQETIAAWHDDKGYYDVLIERIHEPGEPKFRATQRMTHAALREVSPETAAEYQREIEDWLTSRYDAEVSFNPSTRTFDARRSVGFADVPTEQFVVELLSRTESGAAMHDVGTRELASLMTDRDALLSHLERTEIVDAERFSSDRENWVRAQETDGGIRERLEAIGSDRMQPAEWAAALTTAQSGYANDEARTRMQRGLMNGLMRVEGRRGAVPLAAIAEFENFAYRGRINDRALLTQYLRAVAEDREAGFTDDFRCVAEALSKRLAQAPLIDRSRPRAGS